MNFFALIVLLEKVTAYQSILIWKFIFMPIMLEIASKFRNNSLFFCPIIIPKIIPA